MNGLKLKCEVRNPDKMIPVLLALLAFPVARGNDWEGKLEEEFEKLPHFYGAGMPGPLTDYDFECLLLYMTKFEAINTLNIFVEDPERALIGKLCGFYLELFTTPVR